MSREQARVACAQAETSAGGLPPRVIALDDYFMIEDDDGEPVYKHEPEMEAAYRSEALKAFRKAAAEGKEQREPSRSARFNNAILIVDACNLRVSELLEWVHAAVGAGYSTFVASCAGDAAECAARNVHGWSAEKVRALTPRLRRDCAGRERARRYPNRRHPLVCAGG